MIYCLRDMIYGLRRMIYLCRHKYDIISVPSYAKRISSAQRISCRRHITRSDGTDIIEKTLYYVKSFFMACPAGFDDLTKMRLAASSQEKARLFLAVTAGATPPNTR